MKYSESKEKEVPQLTCYGWQFSFFLNAQMKVTETLLEVENDQYMQKL